jgi:hypothetical protein
MTSPLRYDVSITVYPVPLINYSLSDGWHNTRRSGQTPGVTSENSEEARLEVHPLAVIIFHNQNSFPVGIAQNAFPGPCPYLRPLASRVRNIYDRWIRSLLHQCPSRHQDLISRHCSVFLEGKSHVSLGDVRHSRFPFH